MIDIFRAIFPKEQHFQDLTQRMRRFAAKRMTARLIWIFKRLSGRMRFFWEQTFVGKFFCSFFKETVNNVAKRPESTKTGITMKLDGGLLEISFRDNGRRIRPKSIGEQNCSARLEKIVAETDSIRWENELRNWVENTWSDQNRTLERPLLYLFRCPGKNLKMLHLQSFPWFLPKRVMLYGHFAIKVHRVDYFGESPWEPQFLKKWLKPKQLR